MNIQTLPLDQLELLDVAPPPELLPFPRWQPNATWGAVFEEAFEISDQAEADEYLRALVFYTIRYRNFYETETYTDKKGRPRRVVTKLRAMRINEGFALARLNLSTYAGCKDVSVSPGPISKEARRHVERFFRAIDPALGSVDAPRIDPAVSLIAERAAKRTKARAARRETELRQKAVELFRTEQEGKTR